jgi:hypothetical protein
MRFAAPIDMAKTPDDVKKEATQYGPSPSRPTFPLYSWRHCFSLDGDDLDKLKMEMPDQGDIVHFLVTGKVTSRSENEREDTEGKITKTRCVEVQITSFAPEVDEVVEVEEATKARRKRFYDEGDGDADADDN